MCEHWYQACDPDPFRFGDPFHHHEQPREEEEERPVTEENASSGGRLASTRIATAAAIAATSIGAPQRKAANNPAKTISDFIVSL